MTKLRYLIYLFAFGACLVAFPGVVERPERIHLRVEGEWVLDHPVTITRDLILDGPGRIVLENDGRIVVEAGSVTIADLDIEWRAPEGAAYPAIFQSGGHLALTDNRIVIDVKTFDPVAHGNAAQWFLRVEARGGEGSLVIKGNQVDGLVRYGAGFLYAAGLAKFSPVKIAGNDLSGVHGGFYLADSERAEIQGNSLAQVSFGNIVLSDASDTLVEGNSILVPGNGTAGDGLTIAGGSDNVIKKNAIRFGTCFGIQVLPGIHGVQRLHVEDNDILGGITSALFILGTEEQPIQGLSIERNTIVGNNGYALFADFVNGLTFESNVVSGNSERNGAQHLFGEAVSISSWKDNLTVLDYSQDTRADPSFRPAQEYRLEQVDPLVTAQGN